MKKLYTFALVATSTLFSLVSVKGQQPITFAPAITTSFGGTSSDLMCYGDFDHDNKINDVAMISGFYFDALHDYRVWIYRGDSTAGLVAYDTLNYGEHYPGARSVVAGDFDGNGYDDICLCFGDSIGFFYQHSTGWNHTISTRYAGSGGNTNYSLAYGDVNNDGLKDIAVEHWGASDITVLFQDTNHQYTPIHYFAPAAGWDEIMISPLGTDTLNRLIFMSGQTFAPNIRVYYINETQVLDSTHTYTMSPINGNRITKCIGTGDYDSDGSIDLAAGFGGNAPSSNIAMWSDFNNTAPTDTIATKDVPEALEMGDLNCDSKEEIIICHGGWNTISIHSLGQPALNLSVPYTSHYNPKGLVIIDVNGDSKKDIVAANGYAGMVYLKNTTIIPTQYDTSITTYILTTDTSSSEIGSTVLVVDTVVMGNIVYIHRDSLVEVSNFLNTEEMIIYTIAEYTPCYQIGSTFDTTSILTSTFIGIDTIHYLLTDSLIITSSKCDTDLQNVFSLYPNPATNTITITSTLNTGSDALILDLAGRKVWSGMLYNQDTISIDKLVSGVYIFKTREASRLFIKE